MEMGRLLERNVYFFAKVRNRLYIVASWYVIEVGRGNSARGRNLDLEYNSSVERVHDGPRTNPIHGEVWNILCV